MRRKGQPRLLDRSNWKCPTPVRLTSVIRLSIRVGKVHDRVNLPPTLLLSRLLFLLGILHGIRIRSPHRARHNIPESSLDLLQTILRVSAVVLYESLRWRS